MSKKIEKEIYFGSKDEIKELLKNNTLINLRSIINCEIYDGDWLLSENISITNEKYKIIQLGNIGFGKFKAHKFKYISESTFKKLKCSDVPPGSFVINRMQDKRRFNSCIVSEDDYFVTSVDVLVIPNNKIISNTALSYLFQTPRIQASLLSQASGSGRIRITKNNLLNNINLYTFSTRYIEEKSIILSQIDKLIQIQLNKNDLCIKFKKIIMNTIFRTLEFKLFKLMDIAIIKKGSQLNKLDMIENGIYEVINGGVNKSGYTNKFNAQNSITISEGGNSCGYVNYVDKKFWLGGHCYSIDVTSDIIDKLYLFYYLKYKQHDIERLRVGSGLPNIQKKDINNFSIEYPILNIQRNIVNFLSLMDNLLTSFLILLLLF